MKTKRFWYYHKQLTEHKTLETQFDFWGRFLVIDMSIRYTTKTDHAGFNFSLTLFGFSYEFGINDNRHWNDDTNNWEIYNGEVE